MRTGVGTQWYDLLWKTWKCWMLSTCYPMTLAPCWYSNTRALLTIIFLAINTAMVNQFRVRILAQGSHHQEQLQVLLPSAQRKLLEEIFILNTPGLALLAFKDFLQKRFPFILLCDHNSVICFRKVQSGEIFLSDGERKREWLSQKKWPPTSAPRTRWFWS